MAESPVPWRCPECKTWIRADVTEHRCGPDGGVPAVKLDSDPPQPPMTATVTGTAWPQAWATGSTTIPGVGVTYVGGGGGGGGGGVPGATGGPGRAD